MKDSDNKVFNSFGRSSLRFRFIVPIVSSMVLLLLIMAVSLFYFQSQSQSLAVVGKRLNKVQELSSHFFEHSVHNDAAALHSIVNALYMDDETSSLFAQRDRDALYAHTKGLYDSLNRSYNVTHFYFINPDGVNLLRVHAPKRHGDTIDRITLARAEKNGVMSYGVELGVLGTLTLRVVKPWHDNETGELIGYVELGMEIDHIIDRIRETFDLDIAVAIYKKHLAREAYLEGMSVMGRGVNWDRYDALVLARNDQRIPAVIDGYLKGLDGAHAAEIENIKAKEKSYWILAQPIKDVRGKEVANMAMLADVTYEINATERTMIIVGSSVLILFVFLIVLFYVLARRIENRLKADEEELEELATSDNLTKLYTRKVFDVSLAREVERARRFDHEVTLLMIDLDFFKKVNDQYGHQAGDRVLREVGKRISREVRAVDFVCRYGGEEIAIIAPETDETRAIELAERILAIVAALPFHVGDEERISLTVSIGIASYPKDGGSDVLLISAADKALYSAKQNGRNQMCCARRRGGLDAAVVYPAVRSAG